MERSKRIKHSSRGSSSGSGGSSDGGELVPAASASSSGELGPAAARELPLLELLSGQDVRESVLLLLDRVQLTRLLRAVSRDVRTWIEQLLRHIGLRIRLVDVLVNVRVLRRLADPEVAREGDEIFLCAAMYDLTGGQVLGLRTKRLELVGEASGEKLEIRRDEDSDCAVVVYGEGVAIESIKVSSHVDDAELNCAWPWRTAARRR